MTDEPEQPVCDPTDAVRLAEVASREAKLALSRVEARQREEQAKASAEVAARFTAEMAEARRGVADAARALTGAMDRLPDHPWTGKRVFKLESQRGRDVWRRDTPKVRIEGVVETMRSATVVPGNMGQYDIPAIGDGFVRLLKGDGMPGLKLERLRTNTEWKLAEPARDAEQ